jgi:hypothetical protein
MNKVILIYFPLLILILPLSTFADQFRIRLNSEPLPNEISIELILKFDKKSIIYHWSPRKSIYPALNSALIIKCRELKSNQGVLFMPYEKVIPKVPNKLDILETKEYAENLKIVPGEKYKYTSLKKGKYSLKLIYDANELRKYPGGKGLTPIRLESNEIYFEIN